MKPRLLSLLICSIIWLPVQATSGSAQDWPDPLVRLISINTDTSSYYLDNKIKFNLDIERINGSTYSDITRVWVCPSSGWDGFLCNSGQFLVSITPDNSITNITIESPQLSLADGSYLITGVSFRNGAVLSGFTLMYPRSGVVTIGGIATNIPLVDFTNANFTLTPPAPEPEPTTEPEPEPVTESDPEPMADEPPAETEGATEGEVVTEVVDSNDSTETTPTDAASTEQTGEESGTEETASEDESQSAVKETVIDSDVAEADPINDQSENNSTQEEETEAPAESTQVVNEPVAPSSGDSSSSNSVITQPEVVIPPVIETKPELESTQVIAPELTEKTEPEPVAELSPLVVKPATMKVLTKKGAIGGKALVVSGESKLVKRLAAGVGQITLLKSNNSNLKLLLNGSVIRDVVLNRDQVITWFSRKPVKLKLLLSGDKPRLVIDALAVNGNLIKNPLFQMRN